MSQVSLQIPGKDGKRYKELLVKAIAAGWKVVPRKMGWMVYPPNGDQAFLMHKTYGSDKAYKTLRLKFRRGGLDV